MYRNRLTLPPHCTQTLSLTSASSLTLPLTLPHSLIPAPYVASSPFLHSTLSLLSFLPMYGYQLWPFCPVHIVKHIANSENLFNLLRCVCTCNESVLCTVLGHCAAHHWLLQLLLTSLTSLLWCSHTCAGGSGPC